MVGVAFLAVVSAPVWTTEAATSAAGSTAARPLRIYDDRLRAAVFDAAERSPTLRILLTRLADFKAIVLIQWSPALGPRLDAATLPQVTVTPETRYLYIAIKPAKVTDYLVSVVAHEVQHTIEILESGQTEPAAIVGLFRASARGLPQRLYCTPSAVDAGRAVLEELRHARH